MSRLASRNKKRKERERIYPSQSCIVSLKDNLALRVPYSCYRFLAASDSASTGSCVWAQLPTTLHSPFLAYFVHQKQIEHLVEKLHVQIWNSHRSESLTICLIEKERTKQNVDDKRISLRDVPSGVVKQIDFVTFLVHCLFQVFKLTRHCIDYISLRIHLFVISCKRACV